MSKSIEEHGLARAGGAHDSDKLTCDVVVGLVSLQSLPNLFTDAGRAVGERTYPLWLLPRSHPGEPSPVSYQMLARSFGDHPK